ncbi:MAG: type II toxin-antitoxin system VapC family toxin [Syntrophus sp. (in: bacteria)]
MTYLLDTCVISDFVKGLPATLKRIKETSPDMIVVSAISRMEIEYGLNLNPERARKIVPVLQAFLASIRVLPFGETDAQVAGTIRATLQRQGNPIGSYDVLIAGTALAQGLTLVTSNTGEFSRVGGLSLEDWRV